ncbi:MAG: hypothetical protein KHZ87_04715 [Clostridiales bacterium]|nr:hypothetical protein [Clostridiales bacterium]MBS5877829.1 hypothetical protein [Clostridiales bacterium]
MSISLRLDEADTALFKKFAELHGITVSELIRSSVMQRIEDEYDLKVFEEYEAEKANGTLKTRPINQLWEELEL